MKANINKKKLFTIIAIVVVLVVSVSVLLVCMNTCKENKPDSGDNTPTSEQITITFETNGGSKIEPVTIAKGSKLENIPQAYLAGNSFDGWYTDEELTEEFQVDSEITKNITLYAGYTLIVVDVNVTKPVSQYAEDVEQNHSVTIIATDEYSREDFLKAIKIEGLSTVMPWEMPEELDESLPTTIDGWFDVSISGSRYTLSPKKLNFNGQDVYAFISGKYYQITIPTSMHFEGFEDSVIEYSFRIITEKKDSAENVEYRNKDALLFVNKDEIKNIDEITDTAAGIESGSVITEVNTFLKDINGYYNLLFTETNYKKYNFEKDDILCIGNGEELAVGSLFVKVVEIYGQSSGDLSTEENVAEGEYLILAIDAEVEEVFSYIDVNYNEAISTDDIISSLDVEEIKQTVRTNGSLEKVTDIMTGLLMVSDEVQEVYNSDYKARVKRAVDPNTGLPDFCSNTYITNEKKLLSAKLLKDAEVSISIGEGHNPNFDAAYTDNFVALKIVFSYETTIKNKLEVNAEIVFTQYLALSAQGYLEYKMGWFSLKWAEFDAAINLYSQTDFDFKILVRTVNKDGDKDKNDKKEDKENPFVNIADKISEKLKSEDGDDPNNLVAELQEMLNSEEGYLELFRAPLLNIPIDIIPGIPVMRFTVKLDFVIEMNFAAGFSAHMSVLEAIQVGVKGDTRTKSISSYKHDLPGGNQYAVQLSACGYLGIRAGFEGGLSLSFCGLSKLGDVGVYVYVGPYVDIYGFAQATFTKHGIRNSVITQSLVGGYYVEIGIFLEITLEARSDLFGVKIGTTLFDQKWPLVSFGNKEVLISIDQGGLDETIYIENKGEETASISLDLLPKLKGHYLDITTGDVTERDVPWEKVTLKMSANNFSYDPYNGVINYRSNPSLDKLGSETCVATYHYNGSILQFSASAEKYKEFYPFAQTTIIYYDSSKIDKEDAGKMVNVKFYSLVDGKKELMQEQEVMIGTTIRGHATLDFYTYTNITWDKEPYATMITDEGMEFTCSGEFRQVYTAFIYYDLEKGVWVTDIRACNLGEVPVAPEIPEKEGKLTFKGWRGQDGVNVENRLRITPSDHVGTTITAQHLKQYGFFADTTYGKNPNESVAFYVPEENNDWTPYEELTNPEHTSESGRVWYYTVISIYLANYDYDNCTVTIYNSDAEGNQIIDTESVSYLGSPTGYKVYSPLSREFVGFALEEGGEVVYKDLSNIRFLKHDITLYAVYKDRVHEINLYKYDALTNEYSLYKKVGLGGGKQLSELGDDLEAIKIADNATAEGVLECNFVYLQGRESDESNDYVYVSGTNICVRPLDIYPIFRRNVKVIFDAGEGKIVQPEGFVSQIEYYAESIWNYTIKNYPIPCLKESDDPRYSYEHVGWENQVTGEKIYLKDSSSSSSSVYDFEAICDRPTTLKAIYDKIERTDYSVYIETPYGTLKDGKSSVIDLKNLTYEEYNKYVVEYEGWRPADYHDDENHCTWTFNGRTDMSTDNTYHIEYMPSRVVDKFTVDIDYNGGRQAEGSGSAKFPNIAWGSEIDLSLQKAERVDDYGTWQMDSWTDEAGNTYPLDAVYKVSGNDTLTLNWRIATYIDYKIEFTVKNVNDNVISREEKIYHKGDSLESIGNPEVADGKVFSGWTWKHWDYTLIEDAPLDKMPAEDIRLEGNISEVEIIYILDGREIDRTTGRVAYEESVKDNYSKEGYTVTPWTTSDVTVVDGKFVMPEKDVTFTATSSINSYKLTYYHNNEVYIAEQTIEYGKLVRLPSLPVEENVEYMWVSSDVKIYDIGFYMPANDVVIQTSIFESVKYIIYYVNDEIVSYRQGTTGQQFSLLDLSSDSKYEGLTFSGWYTEDATISNNSTLTVGKADVRIYGYFTKGNTKVNIYFNESKSSPDLVLYADEGDTLTVEPSLLDKEISGYKVNGVVSSVITVHGTADIDAYVQYGAKEYKVGFVEDVYGFTMPETAYYVAGTKVKLPALPTYDDLECGAWFTVEAEILSDTDGSFYFIMPASDVMISVIVKEYDCEETFKTAKVYVNSPYSNEPVFYKDYIVYSGLNNTAPVYFDIPAIEGYEFVCWKDESGESMSTYQGLMYSDMLKDTCCYYGEYRKLELHIIEFRINNEVVAYREFYDSCTVTVNSPIVELKDGEDFSGWHHELLNVRTSGEGTIGFYLGDQETHQYAGMDFIFNGYIYNSENAYEVMLNENADNDLYYFYVNLGSQIKLSRMLKGYEVSYELEVNHGDGFITNFADYNFVVQSGEEYIISIPTLEELKTILEISDESEIISFCIIARAIGENAS